MHFFSRKQRLAAPLAALGVVWHILNFTPMTAAKDLDLVKKPRYGFAEGQGKTK